MTSRFKSTLKWLFGIGLLALLLYYVDWVQTARLLGQVEWAPVVLALVLSAASLVLSSLKWRLLLRTQSLEFSLSSLVRYYWIGNFFTNYMPSNVGGDIVRLAIMRHYNQSAAIASSIVVERLTGFAVLVAFCCAGLVMRPEYYRNANMYEPLWLGVIAAACAILGAAIFGKRLVAVFSYYLGESTRWHQRISSLLTKIVDSVALYEKSRSAVILAVLYSVPFYLLIAVFQLVILRAFGVQIPFQEALFVAPAILFISMLPIAPNAIGVAEGAFVLLYTQVGLSPELALAAAFLRRIVDLLVSLVGGLLWVWYPSGKAD